MVKRLLVIGGASFDILHLPDQTVSSVGGAGMYIAMAARRCGVEVSMFGPRPNPCPESLQLVAGYVSEWLGPVVSPEELPKIEIKRRISAVVVCSSLPAARRDVDFCRNMPT